MTLEPRSQDAVPEKFSQADLRRMGGFLTDAADEFSQHGCNDFGCMATAENKALFIRIIKWQTEQAGGDRDPQWLENVERVQAEDKEIFSFDNWAMGYFGQRCDALAKNNAASASELSPAELNMIAALFDVMVDFREIDQEDHDITVDYTLSATDENKQFIAKVIKHEGDAGWERMVEGVMNSEDEIAVLDVWIMRYYSDRCKKLAANQ